MTEVLAAPRLGSSASTWSPTRSSSRRAPPSPTACGPTASSSAPPIRRSRGAAARGLRAVQPQPRQDHRHGRALGRADQVRRQLHAGDQDQLHERDRRPRRAARGRRGDGPPGHRRRPAHRLPLHLSRRRLRRLVLSQGREGADRTPRASVGFEPSAARRGRGPQRHPEDACSSTKISGAFRRGSGGQDLRALGPRLQAQHRRHARGGLPRADGGALGRRGQGAGLRPGGHGGGAADLRRPRGSAALRHQGGGAEGRRRAGHPHRVAGLPRPRLRPRSPSG